ncbi:MAG TPA: hypothetical protein PKK43_14780, partial [Spirochaetota bacterium]|nr:hypothetical protein [Spirochaetota bacterium]
FKNVREGRIVCYLPWKYDNQVIEELNELAKKYEIPFHVDNNRNAVIGIWVFIIILIAASVIINYAL